MKKKLLTFLAISLVATSLVFAKGTFNITEETGMSKNYITVTGQGVAKALPDCVTFSVSIDEVADSTSEALSNANAKVREVYTALEKNGIPTRDAETSSISIAPRYEWKDSNKVLKGQGVNQSITVRIDNYSKNDDNKLGAVIDDLGKITGIQIGSIQFAIKDKSELYREARRLAVRNAMDKVNDFAGEAGLTVKQINTISEGTNAAAVYNNARFYAVESKAMANDESYVGTSIVSGDVEVTVYVTLSAEV